MSYFCTDWMYIGSAIVLDIWIIVSRLKDGKRLIPQINTNIGIQTPQLKALYKASPTCRLLPNLPSNLRLAH